MRIVSLIASATEMVHALGLGEYQVGRSHECDYPSGVACLPSCTEPRFDINGNSREIDQRVKETLRTAESVYQVFDQVLERLKPTHVITQTQCKVCAVSLDDVERALSGRISSRPKVIALEPNSLNDIFRDVQRVADACDVPDRGEALVEFMKAQMNEISARARKACRTKRKARIFNVEWVEPIMAAGNWLPELIEMLGAENLFTRAAEHSPYTQWSDVLAADPDVIICMPCGYGLEKTRTEMHWLTSRPEWPKLKAACEGRVYLTDANQYMTRPGPRIVDSLRILAEILYPETFEPHFIHKGWERF